MESHTKMVAGEIVKAIYLNGVASVTEILQAVKDNGVAADLVDQYGTWAYNNLVHHEHVLVKISRGKYDLVGRAQPEVVAHRTPGGKSSSSIPEDRNASLKDASRRETASDEVRTLNLKDYSP
jgi:hypothetical protein